MKPQIIGSSGIGKPESLRQASLVWSLGLYACRCILPFEASCSFSSFVSFFTAVGTTGCLAGTLPEERGQQLLACCPETVQHGEAGSSRVRLAIEPESKLDDHQISDAGGHRMDVVSQYTIHKHAASIQDRTQPSNTYKQHVNSCNANH